MKADKDFRFSLAYAFAALMYTYTEAHLQVAFTQHLYNFLRQIHVTTDNAVILLRSEKVNARVAHVQ